MAHTRWEYRFCLAVVVLSLSTPVSAAQSASVGIGSLIDAADAIVVGTVSNSNFAAETLRFKLGTTRVLKGPVIPGQLVEVEFREPGVQRAVEPTVGDCGIWFLRNTAKGQWDLLPVERSGRVVSFTQAYFAASSAETLLRYPYGENSSTIDKVISEIAEAAELTGGETIARQLTFTIGASDSPLVTRLYRNWSRSPSPHLKALGLGGLIAIGNDNLILEALPQLGVIARSSGSQKLANAISIYRGNNGTIIEALGRLGVNSAAPRGFRLAAVEVMKGVHSRETIPYLAKLLDDTEADYREMAVEGLGLYAMDVPVAKPSEETRVFEQTRTRLDATDHPKLRSAGEFLHFGPFLPEENEHKYLDYWRQWAATLP